MPMRHGRLHGKLWPFVGAAAFQSYGTLRLRHFPDTRRWNGSAIVSASFTAARAQYYYPPPPTPEEDYGPPPGYYQRPPPGYYDRPCPPGFTVQSGACKPYRGPAGGNWRTWNGCPPGYTVQGGECRAYCGY
jgi:hypothetical protein